jgi:hypothetical protein
MTPPAISVSRRSRDEMAYLAAATAGRHRARPTGRAAAPRVHRRVSGPVRRPATAGVPARALPAPTLADHLAAAGARLSRLPDASVVARLVASRAWIGLVAFLLFGIVFMQVHLLKLNAGISRAVETATTLEQQNDELRVSISRKSSGTRIDSEAARLGMVRPEPGDVRYLRIRRGGRDAKLAARTMTAPSGTYAATTTTQGAATTTQQPAATTQPAAITTQQPAATATQPSQPVTQPQSGAVAEQTSDEYPASGVAGAAAAPQG